MVDCAEGYQSLLTSTATTGSLRLLTWFTPGLRLAGLVAGVVAFAAFAEEPKPAPQTAKQSPDVKARARATDHWAFRPPAHPAIPRARDRRWVRNPVDAFILDRLEQERIKPSPEADRTTLIRRLSLDLLGLPPSVEAVETFLKDRRPDAYERLVDELLESPHFGEHWARHWLDLARYADSDGYEKDSPRPYAWLFRDWVIEAINRDLPFDQFTIEQLAGDLLPDATKAQLVATGFHRQTLTNREGGVDKEEDRCKATVDRVSTTGTVWLGLTVGCAECHNHKYDPISQREFYQLYAFFNNASEKDIPAPQPVELDRYNQELAGWEAKLAEAERGLNSYLTSGVPAKLADWEKSVKVPATRWSVIKPEAARVQAGGEGADLVPDKDGSISPRANDGPGSTFIIESAANLKRITGFRIEALHQPGTLIGRGKSGDFGLSEFSVVAATTGAKRKIELASAKADFASTNGDAAGTIDGDRRTGWKVWPETNRAHVIVFGLREPLELPGGARLIFTLDLFEPGALDRFRISATASDGALDPSRLPDGVIAALETTPAARTAEQAAAIERFFVAEIDDEGTKLHQQIAAQKARKPKYPPTTAAVLTAEARKTQIHIRGDFLRKGDEVEPGGLAVLPGLAMRSGKGDRLDLARWLVDPVNPLTARVTVNHVWRNLFGRGLVGTMGDFGVRGEKPSHPELLDWLAGVFSSSPGAEPAEGGSAQRLASRASASGDAGLGWSRKALIKLMVTSSTYRQASRIRPELVGRDPNNLLLARQNRFRLEAENVRDIYLAVSGLLNPAIGGPSIRPPMPADIAALGYANQVKWTATKGPEQYRRGLYVFFQRTVPYPMLMAFDAPDSNSSCTRRERSNTPIQALTLLNDPVFFECAQALGQRMGDEPGPPEEKIRRAFQRCLGRVPEAAELNRLLRLYADQVQLLKGDSENAERILGQKTGNARELEEGAALVAVSRVIMNLDEFVSRN